MIKKLRQNLKYLEKEKNLHFSSFLKGFNQTNNTIFGKSESNFNTINYELIVPFNIREKVHNSNWRFLNGFPYEIGPWSCIGSLIREKSSRRSISEKFGQ